ncbi:MAG: twin-arginine translocation signal domain-containing protein, partial [Acidobacteriota bacterium]|nr:twin-arginine translocation signal domain-containing protein [Acidobacteriota bacterium]
MHPKTATRRTFVKGLALGGAMAGLGAWPPLARAQAPPRRPWAELTGTRFDLTVGETPMNFTGAP